MPAIRGDAEDTGNGDLTGRVLGPIEHTLPEPSRYTRLHQGRGQMLDHLLITPQTCRPTTAARTPQHTGGPMAESATDPMPVDGACVDRTLIARIAAAERWARTPDRVAATGPARRGLRARFEREADPEGVLDVAERDRRPDVLFTAHMLRLARASATARRNRLN